MAEARLAQGEARQGSASAPITLRYPANQNRTLAGSLGVGRRYRSIILAHSLALAQ